MKKSWLSFAGGMLVMAMLMALMAPAMAAGTFNGRAEFGKVGVEVFSKRKYAPGVSMTAANGEKVPVTITYTDAKGGTTHYIAAEKVAELFDMSEAPSWDSANNCVDFIAEHKGEIHVVKVDLDEGETVPTGLPPHTITVARGSKENMEKLQAQELAAVPTAPKLGATAGPIKEVSAKTVDRTNMGFSLYNARFESMTGVSEDIYCADGEYTVITVKNESSCDVKWQVVRPYTVRAGGESQWFTTIKIPAGQTAERAFYVTEGSDPLKRSLSIGLTAVKEDAVTRVVISAETTQDPPVIGRSKK